MSVPKRKRYVVTVEGNDQTKSIVIIAYDLKGMYREVHKLYDYLLKDVNGKEIGKISYKESSLN